MIDKIGDSDDLFTLTVSSFIDRYTKAIAGLPGVLHIWILLDCANHGFAANSLAWMFAVPPKKFPTIRAVPPVAEPQISSLIADAHSPSSDDHSPRMTRV
jgi:hypothetical protein